MLALSEGDSTMTTPRSCTPLLSVSRSRSKLALGVNARLPTSHIAAGGTLARLRRARVTTTPGSCNLTLALSGSSLTQTPAPVASCRRSAHGKEGQPNNDPEKLQPGVSANP